MPMLTIRCEPTSVTILCSTERLWPVGIISSLHVCIFNYRIPYKGEQSNKNSFICKCSVILVRKNHDSLFFTCQNILLFFSCMKGSFIYTYLALPCLLRYECGKCYSIITIVISNIWITSHVLLRY